VNVNWRLAGTFCMCGKLVDFRRFRRWIFGGLPIEKRRRWSKPDPAPRASARGPSGVVAQVEWMEHMQCAQMQ
jgi:hypothetical protein